MVGTVAAVRAEAATGGVERAEAEGAAVVMAVTARREGLEAEEGAARGGWWWRAPPQEVRKCDADLGSDLG